MKITIVEQPLKKPDSAADSTVVDFGIVREWITTGEFLKHLFLYREAEFLIYSMKNISRPFLSTLLLRLLSRGSCSLRDEQGQQKRVTFLLLSQLFWNLLKDGLYRFSLIKKLKQEIESLFKQQDYPERKDLNMNASAIYLRTDLSFGLRSGGSVAHIAGVLNHLDHFTKKPIFLSTDNIPMVREDLEIHLISPGKEFWDFKELLSLHFNEDFLRIARTLLDKKKISFVYQRYSLNNFSGVILSKEYRVPLVLEYNGSEIWVSRNWSKPLKYEKLSEQIEFLNLKRADLIVVVSQSIRDELIARNIDPHKVLLNPNGVDPERYSPSVDGSAVRREYSLEGKTVIGFIGTFGKWHGAEILAEAFGTLLHKYPEYQGRVKLFMIGDGMTMPLVKENIDKFLIKESCVLTGLIRQEEGPKHLAACDVLVASHKPNPDGTPFFGSPTKLFEYMAMGKGIVASDLDQIGEVLKHDHTAWLVKPGDVESLMTGLKTLIDDKSRRDRLGKAARQEVVAKYTWREHTRRIIQRLYELESRHDHWSSN